jgi:hypothetical protein
MALSSGFVKTATYLYCVVRATGKPASADVPDGLPGAMRAEVIAVSPSLWLVAAAVPLDVYGPGPLESILGDLEQVGRIGLAHEAVVEHFAGRPGLTVVPMKLFTMFSTRERAVADIAARRRSLEAAMKRIEGAEEWGVRVTATMKPAPGRTAPGRRSTSGAAFLAAKRRARDEVQNARVAAAEAAGAAFERLNTVAKDARRRLDAPAAGTPPLLDAAFLVRSKDRDRFTAAAREEADSCARAGAHLTLTGPWPAYNFIQTDGGQ